MAIITLNEVKTLLQIPSADTTKDTLINTLIPIAQKSIIRYCKNSFLNSAIRVTGSGIAFVVSGTSPNFIYTITDENSRFVENKFSAGDYKVSGSNFNDQIVTVTEVTADTLTTSTVLKTEVAEEWIAITRVEFPEEIKPLVAQLINYHMTLQGKSVKSESLPGGYSVTFKDEVELMKPFNQFRKPYL